MTAKEIKPFIPSSLLSDALRTYILGPHPKLRENQSGIVHIIGIDNPETDIPQLLKDGLLPRGSIQLSINPNCLNEEEGREFINIWVSKARRKSNGEVEKIKSKHKYLIVIDSTATNVADVIDAFAENTNLLYVDNKLED